MAEKKKGRIRIVELYITPSAFTSIFRRIRGERIYYDFSGIADLRKLLSNEKAKVLNTIKNQNPSSLYHLAKLLGRDFKSVSKDIKILQRFGFIELKPAVKGKRKMLKPIIATDKLQVNVSFQ